MRYSGVKGTYDILPLGPKREAIALSSNWHYIEKTFRELVHQWGYGEIRTPIFESTDLIHRSAGEGSDVASKETYDFTTKGGDNLTLRPEGTAGVMRAFLEHSLQYERPVWKLYYIGPNFRYEAPQKGRYRQHHQAGVELLGSSDPASDAEVIALAVAFYQKLGLTDMQVKLNSLGNPASRTAYLQALRDWATPLLPQMSEDNKRRFEQNALRMLDSKDKGDIALLKDAPRLADYLDEESRNSLSALLGHLKALGIAYELDDRLVRGFDYYTGTVFEIQSVSLGDKALGGGGRYDNLVSDLGGPATPGIGFGLGLERVLLALEESGVAFPAPNGLDVFLCPLGDAARAACVPLLAQVRAAGLSADMAYSGKKPAAMFASADKLGARYAIIVGENEIAEKIVQLRDQQSEEKTQVPVPWDGVVGVLQEKTK
jgi:histidyl-tRNA synthetase